MSQAEPQPFPFLRTAVVLTLAAAALTTLGLFVGPSLYPVKAVRLVIAASCFMVWVTSLLGVLPVAILGHRGLMPAVWGYFIGMALRFPLSFAFYLIAVIAWRWPGNPVVFALALSYIPLLFVEVGIVGRYIWQKDGAIDHAAPSGAHAALPPEASA